MALRDNLISWWALEEASGTRVDSHGSNPLADNNTVTSATGKIGDGADFEASNSEYLSIADGSQTGLDLSGDFSVAFWVKLETIPTSGSYTPFSKFTSDQAYRFLFLDNGEVQAYVSADGTSSNRNYFTSSSTPLGGGDVGAWAHWVLTYDVSANVFTVHKNNSSVSGSNTVNGTVTSINNSDANFILGGYDNGSSLFLDGIMDEVGIWSRVLSDAEITTLYNGGDGIGYASTEVSAFTATIDGMMFNTTDDDFSGMRDGTGDGVNDTGVEIVTTLDTDTTTDDFSFMYRNGVGFATDSIDGDTITAATLKLYITEKITGLDDVDIDITGFTPTSETDIVAGDYDVAKHASTRLVTGINTSSISTGGYLTFTLNAAGLAYINKTGNTFFSVRHKWDVDDNFTGTWGTNQQTGIKFGSSEATNAAHRPVLTVEHSSGATFTPSPMMHLLQMM